MIVKKTFIEENLCIVAFCFYTVFKFRLIIAESKLVS